MYRKNVETRILDKEILEKYPSLLNVAEYSCVEEAKYSVMSYSELMVVIHKKRLLIKPSGPEGTLLNVTDVNLIPQCVYLQVIDKGSRSTRVEGETLILVFDKYTFPQLVEPRFTLFNNVYLPEVTGVYIYADRDVLKEMGSEYTKTYYKELTREYGVNVSSRILLYLLYNKYIGFLTKLLINVEFRYNNKAFFIFKMDVDLIETNAPLSKLEFYEKIKLPAIIAGVAVALGVSSIIISRIIREKTKPREFRVKR